jgi:hypothetical protein
MRLGGGKEDRFEEAQVSKSMQVEMCLCLVMYSFSDSDNWILHGTDAWRRRAGLRMNKTMNPIVRPGGFTMTSMISLRIVSSTMLNIELWSHDSFLQRAQI